MNGAGRLNGSSPTDNEAIGHLVAQQPYHNKGTLLNPKP